MFRTTLFAAALATAGASTALWALDHWQTGLDLSKAHLDSFRMTMFKGEEAIGFMEYGWSLDGDSYVISDRTEMQPNVVEVAKGVLDSTSLLPTSVTIDFAVGDNLLDVDLSWTDGWRKGRYINMRENARTTRDVNVQEDKPATLRMAVFGLVAAMPLREGFKTTLPWFNTLVNRVEDVAVIVAGSETTDTPAGRFQTYKIELRGGSPENIMYVTQTTPRQIVRIDVVGHPMHFELAATPVEFLN